jgi:hypothetical protein
MRCRDNRRADLHYSQLDNLKEHLDKTNIPRYLVTAIIQGITGWYHKPNYQNVIFDYLPELQPFF